MATRRSIPNPIGKIKMKDPWADPTKDDFPLMEGRSRPKPGDLINKRGKAARGVSRREAGLPTRYEQSGATNGVNPAGKAAAGYSRREAGLATKKPKTGKKKPKNIIPPRHV